MAITGNNAVLRMLYEVDGDAAVEGRLLDVPSLWRYRARVTLEHLKRELEAQSGSQQKTSPYPVLDMFLREVVVVALIIGKIFESSKQFNIRKSVFLCQFWQTKLL